MRYTWIAVLLLLAGCGSSSDGPCEGPPQGLYGAGPGKDRVVYNPGHLNCAQGEVIDALVAAGFEVDVVFMPPGPHSSRRVPDDFVNPVFESVAEKSYQGDGSIYMIGLSGGGWTTDVACSLDARIEKCVSISGSLPDDHPGSGRYTGDYEQVAIQPSYRDIYAMAAPRLRHIHIWDDDCCFARATGNLGVPYVMDFTVAHHTISPWAIEWVIGYLRDGVESPVADVEFLPPDYPGGIPAGEL